MRRIPRVPWHAEVRVGSHYHKLYSTPSSRARSLLASLGRVDVVHAHLHDGALIGYFVSRLWRSPAGLRLSGQPWPGRWSTTSSRRESPPTTARWPGLERTIDGLADVILTRLHQRRRGYSRRRGGAAGVASSSRREAGRRGPPVAPLLDGVDVHTFDRPDPEAVACACPLRHPPQRAVVVGYVGLLAESQGVGDRSTPPGG